MIVLSTSHLSYEIGDRDILKDITFALNEGDRLGIIGVNGAGKTTLFRLLAGEYTPTDGAVFRAADRTLGYLKQDEAINAREGETLFDFMLAAFPYQRELETRIAACEYEIAEAEMEEKLRELADLRQMIRGERFWNYAETYVHTIFKTSIDTETLEIKRHFFREYQSILSIRNDGPASFRETAAQFLFNHFVDVPEIEEKREVLEEMLFLWKMNENDTNVTREIARLLVNLIIDEPEESKKRAYFMLMERLATLFPANFEIQLEYAKALVNFSICESPVNEKMEFLKKLFALREKLETPSVQNRQADILTDFLCIYAQGILIFVTLVKDPVQRQESLEQLPPIAKFKKSLFMDVFRSVLKDLLRMETEGPLRRKLEEYMQEAET